MAREITPEEKEVVATMVAKARAAAYPPVENLLTDVYVSY